MPISIQECFCCGKVWTKPWLACNCEGDKDCEDCGMCEKHCKCNKEEKKEAK